MLSIAAIPFNGSSWSQRPVGVGPVLIFVTWRPASLPRRGSVEGGVGSVGAPVPWAQSVRRRGRPNHRTQRTIDGEHTTVRLHEYSANSTRLRTLVCAQCGDTCALTNPPVANRLTLHTCKRASTHTHNPFRLGICLCLSLGSQKWGHSPSR